MQLGAALKRTVLAVLPALFLFTIWRYHVGRAGVDELTLLPFADWNWTHLGEAAASVLERRIGQSILFRLRRRRDTGIAVVARHGRVGPPLPGY